MRSNLIPAPADSDDYSEVIQHYTSRKLTWSLSRKPSQKEPQSKVLSYFHGGYPILPTSSISLKPSFLGYLGWAASKELAMLSWSWATLEQQSYLQDLLTEAADELSIGNRLQGYNYHQFFTVLIAVVVIRSIDTV